MYMNAPHRHTIDTIPWLANGRISDEERRVLDEHLVDCAGLDGFQRHAEDDGCSLVLRDYIAAGRLYLLHTHHSVVAHSGKDHADAHRSGESCACFQSDIGTWAITGDTRTIV